MQTGFQGGRCHRGEVFLEQHGGVETGKGAAAIAHGQIGGAGLQVDGLVACVYVQVDMREMALEGRESGHKPVRGQLGGDRQGDDVPCRLTDVGHGAGDGGKARLHGAQQLLAGLREGDRPNAAGEERAAQIVLQLADAVADGGGGQVQFGCGQLEAFEAGCCLESVQGIEAG